MPYPSYGSCMSQVESFQIGGVPVVIHPPANPNLPAPLIILWHGFGIPNSEEMLAEVLPLATVQAWKAYVGLPLFGKRMPEGGLEEIMQRQFEDYVLQLLLPGNEQALQELSNVVQALRAQNEAESLSVRVREGGLGRAEGACRKLTTKQKGIELNSVPSYVQLPQIQAYKHICT
jgi:hypothetical protein